MGTTFLTYGPLIKIGSAFSFDLKAFPGIVCQSEKRFKVISQKEKEGLQ